MATIILKNNYSEFIDVKINGAFMRLKNNSELEYQTSDSKILIDVSHDGTFIHFKKSTQVFDGMSIEIYQRVNKKVLTIFAVLFFLLALTNFYWTFTEKSNIFNFVFIPLLILNLYTLFFQLKIKVMNPIVKNGNSNVFWEYL